MKKYIKNILIKVKQALRGSIKKDLVVEPTSKPNNLKKLSNREVVLSRLPSSNQGTFGKIQYKDFTAYTLELPDRDNKTNISCVPTGTYKVKWNYSNKFKREMYLITGVNKRSGIRIHSANYAGDKSKGYKKQLYGCIALGKRKGTLEGQRAILVSRPTVKKFELLMKKKEFTLKIL